MAAIQKSKWIVLHGEGTGGKGQMFADNLEKILCSGWHVGKKHIIGQSRSDELFRRDAGKMASNGEFARAQAAIANGPLTESIIGDAEKTCRDLPGPFLYVRSSASKSDKNGAGVYGSFTCKNDLASVIGAIQAVYASYFSEEACLIRKGNEEGIAVQIEPVVGSVFVLPEKKIFAPLLSGFGKSFTHLLKGGYVGVAAGLAADYMKNLGLGIIISEEERRLKMNMIISNYNLIEREGSFAKPLVLGMDGNPIALGQHESHFLNAYSWNLSLDRVFAKMELLGKNCGCPISLEYAIALSVQENPVHYLTQLGFEKPSEYAFEPCKDRRKFVGEGRKVFKGGEAEVKNVVLIEDASGLGSIGEINGKFRDYILVFKNSDFLGKVGNIPYSNLSNMVGLGGIENGPLLEYFGAHFGGLLGMEGKIIANFDSLSLEKLAKTHEGCGYSVYTAKKPLIGKQRRLVFRASEKMQYNELAIE